MPAPVFYDDLTMVTPVAPCIAKPCLVCGICGAFCVIGPARNMQIFDACPQHVDAVRAFTRGESLPGDAQ